MIPAPAMNPVENVTNSRTISAQMAEYAESLRYEQLPADVRKLARLVLLDTVGCALAGSTTEDLRQIRSAVQAFGGSGNAGLWGTRESAALPLAALVNGAAAHAREIDDFGGCAHSGAVVIPAALGTAIQVGASGAELLTAIVIGYDIARRVMDGGGGYLSFKSRGWHSTSTCGGFGAAAAVGRLLKLSPAQLQWALGLAGSNAGGTWAFIPEGAMSKRVHPGFAAQSGVMSAYLAANGISGPDSIFETPWGGFYPTYVGGDAQPARAVEGLGSDFRIRMVGFKPYAACRGIHSSIEAALAMRNEDDVRPANVVRITVRGSSIHCRQLSKQDVRSVFDAQFSLPYSIAAALSTGGAMLDQFTPEALLRPEIQALAHRTEVVLDSKVADGAEPFLDVELAGGRVLTRHVATARGDHTNPLSEDELRCKFRSTAGMAMGAWQVEKLEESISRVAELPNLQELASLLVPQSDPSDPHSGRSMG
jgi:2-methylcitrate dehydratase PrpD